MQSKDLRWLALDLLTDEHGVNKSAYDSLVRLMQSSNIRGIGELTQCVHYLDGRYYLDNEAAEVFYKQWERFL